MHRVVIAFLAACLTLPGVVRASPPPAGDSPPPDRRRNAAPREDTEEDLRLPATFEELFPERARRIRDTGRDHPEWFHRTLRQAHRMARELDELRETNLADFDRRVKLFKKEGETEELAEKLRKADGEPAKTALRKALRTNLEELFDLKEAAQRDRVQRMERELKTLKERLDKRRQAREGIIDRHLRELEGGEDMDF